MNRLARDEGSDVIISTFLEFFKYPCAHSSYFGLTTTLMNNIHLKQESGVEKIGNIQETLQKLMYLGVGN